MIRLGVILFYLGREMVRFEVGGFVVNEGVEHLVSLGKPRDPSPNPSFFLVEPEATLSGTQPQLCAIYSLATVITCSVHRVLFLWGLGNFFS